MRKLFAILGIFGMLAAIGTISASAAYNPPPAVQNVCDAGHGAFGAFSPYAGGTAFNDVYGQPPYFGDSTLGSATGGATGAVNSGYSASCNG